MIVIRANDCSCSCSDNVDVGDDTSDYDHNCSDFKMSLNNIHTRIVLKITITIALKRTNASVNIKMKRVTHFAVSTFS